MLPQIILVLLYLLLTGYWNLYVLTYNVQKFKCYSVNHEYIGIYSYIYISRQDLINIVIIFFLDLLKVSSF